eukprot:gene9702-7569_t
MFIELPIPVVSAALASLRVSQQESWRRTHLWQLVDLLGERLGVPALSPVVPLVIGPESTTLETSSRLLHLGFHAPAIRPPTVLPGTCRLRISLSAAHTQQDVEDLAQAVLRCNVPLLKLDYLEQQQRLGWNMGPCKEETGLDRAVGFGGCAASKGARSSLHQSRM